MVVHPQRLPEVFFHVIPLVVFTTSPGSTANARLARNPGIIASFSRALTEGLTVTQDDREFDAVLDETIGTIAEASRT